MSWTNYDLPVNIVTVSVQNGDFNSINSALNYVLSKSPSASNRWIIKVYPGEYIEPILTIPQFVGVIGIDSKSCIVKPIDVNSDLFNLSADTTIEKLTIDGVTNGAGVKDGSGSDSAFCKDVIFKNCLYGAHSTGLDTKTTLRNCSFGNSVNIGIYSTASGIGGVIASETRLDAVTGVQSDSGVVWIADTESFAGTNLFFANGGEIEFHGANISGVTNVLRLNNGGKITGYGLDSKGGTPAVWEILQEDSLSEVQIYSSQIHQDKISAVDISKIKADFNDQKEGAEGLDVLKELHVGLPEIGYPSAFGSGDAYTRGMLVYTEDDLGTFTDVSSSARSLSGSTFTFTSNTTNNAIYVSSDLQNSDYLKFLGIEAVINSAGVLGAGQIVVEYWNGTIWDVVNTMSVDNDTFLPYGKSIFERGGVEQVRFNIKMINNWVKNDPISSGTPRYWVRFRIASDITTAPVFNQFKLHSNRFETKKDGWVEYFGTARPVAVIPFDINWFQPAGNSPLNQDVYVLNSPVNNTQDLSVGRVENSFADGTIDRSGMCFYAPYNIDTSCPLTFRFTFASRAVGDVVWVVNFGITRDGDTIATSSGGAPSSITGEFHDTIISSVSAIDSQISVEVDIDVSEVIPRRSNGSPDLLWVSIARDGNNASDTMGGNADLIQVSPVYYKWCEGGHI